MKYLTAIGVVTISGLALAAPVRKDAPKKELSIVGEWQLWRVDGKEYAPTLEEKRLISWVDVFNADGTLMNRTGVGKRESVEHSRYAIDLKTDPPQFDFLSTSSDDIMKGIFRIAGDNLTICLQTKRTGARPIGSCIANESVS